MVTLRDELMQQQGDEQVRRNHAGLNQRPTRSALDGQVFEAGDGYVLRACPLNGYRVRYQFVELGNCVVE